ncbi:MAG: ribonuclease D, partial [Candidatus Obscuribacterales bacterium]|nr:ribonuclease D [Candidatus Obscuribacterales bacterium]
MQTELITETSELLKLCALIDKHKIVSLDLEFIPERTYYPVLCLVQCCVDKKPYIIDPLALTDLGPLWERIADPEILTILHAASQDLDLAYNFSDLIPKNIFDTQIAAGFAGYGYSAGYRRLLSEVLNVQIPKTESFSDWHARPLTESQMDYAISDVIYLEPLYDSITAKL